MLMYEFSQLEHTTTIAQFVRPRIHETVTLLTDFGPKASMTLPRMWLPGLLAQCGERLPNRLLQTSLHSV